MASRADAELAAVGERAGERAEGVVPVVGKAAMGTPVVVPKREGAVRAEN